MFFSSATTHLQAASALAASQLPTYSVSEHLSIAMLRLHATAALRPYARVKTLWPHTKASRGTANHSVASVVCLFQQLPAVTSVNQVAAVHTARAALRPAAAPTDCYRVQTPQGHTKTSCGRANSSHMRHKPRLCLIQLLPAPPRLQIRWQPAPSTCPAKK